MNTRGAGRIGAAAGRTTLAQLARSLNVDVREVSRTARLVLGLAPAQARDRELELSAEQCELIGAAVEMRQRPSLIPLADVDAGPRPRAGARALLPFSPDRLAPPHDLQFRGLRHGIWLHPEVSDRLRVWEHLYGRLGIVLQHLAAHGRTTVVKGCRDGNRGWRRSPLGGANGMQYYLWWTPGGSRVASGLALPPEAVLVRAVRHHDDHAPLEAGGLDDYLPLSAPDDLNDDIAGRPWTDAQIRFVEDERPVRLLPGRPGSGKTTVLWKAVEARSGQRVLYLTWSSALTRHAEERFASFAPADVEVVARDFATFVGEICGADVARQALAASRARFDTAITRLGRDMAGPWKNRRDALHAELRAILFGRALPGETGCATERGIARLTDDAYRDLRGDYDGVGPKAAKALLKVARFLPADGVGAVFPELVAATRAIDRLRDDDLPEGFDDFDRIVVDEVQDLTLLESAVVVELCRAVGRRHGRAPWLLMTGDAGQTVRPTAFDWGPLSDLLARRVGVPARFHLEEHLRCPSRIADVVERASERYVDLEKKVRPTKQRPQYGGEHVDAHLVYVHVSRRPQAVELLERLAEADEVVVLSARADVPSWVPEYLRDSVLTPAEAKGSAKASDTHSIGTSGPPVSRSSMPITFETEWVAAEEIRGPELASTWASLLIRVDDAVITRVLDQRAQTIRDRVYVPLYPLAESLVTNWWFLLHEVGNPVKNDDQAFRRRHALVSARDGYAFPRLHVTSSGSRMLLAWMPDSFLWTRLEYRGSDQTGIDKDEFRESCADLVDRVVRRLAAYGIEGTLLQEEWASIQTADRDERLFCKTAAALGWDPYALSDSQQTAVLRLEGVLDDAIFEEALAVLAVERLEADASAIATALQPGHGTRLPLEHVRAACAPTPWAGDSPWQAGYALARNVRQHLGLNSEPLPSSAALGDALRENPAALAAAMQRRDLGGVDLVDGVVASDEDGLPAFALRGGRESNRRFHFCRGLAEVLTSPGSAALLTRTQSDRQQRSRAFAAEFLAPAAALKPKVHRPVLDGEDVDELADEFGVSPWLIAHQLENHQIARIL